jgi:hypothetical protein
MGRLGKGSNSYTSFVSSHLVTLVSLHDLRQRWSWSFVPHICFNHERGYCNGCFGVLRRILGALCISSMSFVLALTSLLLLWHRLARAVEMIYPLP